MKHEELRKLAEAANTTYEERAEMLQQDFKGAWKAKRDFEAAANPAAILALLDELEAARKDAQRLIWAMHNMSNPFGRHEFGFSQLVLERGSTGDIDDCRTYIDTAMEAK